MAAVVAVALALGAALIAWMGIDPRRAYRALFRGSLGSVYGVGESLVKATPLILTGLSFALAFRCGLINIGAEGQLYFGALGAILPAAYLTGLPAALHLPLALLGAFIAGALWGYLAGWLKVRFGAHEMITTVMLNYVAIHIVGFLVTGPLVEPPGMLPQTPLAAPTAQLPRILPGTRLHLGLIVALASLIFYHVLLWKTPRGFEIRVVGLNPHAARYAGIDAASQTTWAMAVAGGLAGLAGAGEVLGVQLRLRTGLSSGLGFDGMAVALLGGNAPAGIFLAALLFGVLRAGGNTMQMLSGVPVGIISVIQGLVILFVVAEHGRKLAWRPPLARRAPAVPGGARPAPAEGSVRPPGTARRPL